MSPLITPEYQRLNMELHAKDPDWGVTGKKVRNMAAAYFRTFECETLLDYGCGKGVLPGARYDPAIPAYAELPEPADLVVCTFVLEHVEPACLIPVLDHLEGLTKRAVFLAVTTRESSKFLSDGRNAHLIVRPIEWWIVVGLAPRWTMRWAENMGHYFCFVGKKR